MGIVKDIIYSVSKKNFLHKFKDQSIFPYYHLVKDHQVAHIEHLYDFKNKKQFEDDIGVLKKYYQPLHPQSLLSNSKLHNNFLLTFDDGLQEVFTEIYPVLKRHNLSAIFFVNPEFVDNEKGIYKHYISIIISHINKNRIEKSIVDQISQRLSFTYNSPQDFNRKLLNLKYADRHKLDDVFELLQIDIKTYLTKNQPYLTKEQIQIMIDDGFFFGGHTMNHAPLNQITHDEQIREIIESIEWLKNQFKIPYSFFSFPFSDNSISKNLMAELFKYDTNIRIFGNAGLKDDIDPRIIQRFSLENPKKQIERQIVTENLYKYFNKFVGTYHIKR